MTTTTRTPSDGVYVIYGETTAEPTPNLPLLRKVIEHVQAHPDEWYQNQWGIQLPSDELASYRTEGHITKAPACGTAYCIAGHAAILSGAEPSWQRSHTMDYVHFDGQMHRVESLAQDLLGLTWEEADDLFHGEATLAQVIETATAIALRAGEVL